MPALYPLRLFPEFRARIWGSRDLSLVYDHARFAEPVGEAWLTGDSCKVADGPLEGLSLEEVCSRFGREFVGETAAEPDRFPLLIKFLFPRERLSVQVHPDDDGARSLGERCGKTECWYVLRAEPGAQVALGLKPGVTKPGLERAILEGRAEQVLNWLDVVPGDLIYVDAGTVHAIGPGLVLVETQQNSDTTFRLYDYGRGRELHIAQGLAAVKERTLAGKVKASPAQPELLVRSPCFEIRQFRGAFSHSRGKGPRACHSVVVLNGEAVVTSPENHPVRISQGEAVIVPAMVENFAVEGPAGLHVLWATVPSGVVPQPETEIPFPSAVTANTTLQPAERS